MTNIKKMYFGKVESAVFRKHSTTAMMMLIVMLVVRIGNSTQKICDTLNLENENLITVRISRRKAKNLAVACGLEKIPDGDKISELIGHEVQVKLTVDEEGEFRVLDYFPVDDCDDISKPVDGGELTF